jgi:hypothetical protein
MGKSKLVSSPDFIFSHDSFPISPRSPPARDRAMAVQGLLLSVLSVLYVKHPTEVSEGTCGVSSDAPCLRPALELFHIRSSILLPSLCSAFCCFVSCLLGFVTSAHACPSHRLLVDHARPTGSQVLCGVCVCVCVCVCVYIFIFAYFYGCVITTTLHLISPHFDACSEKTEHRVLGHIGEQIESFVSQR